MRRSRVGLTLAFVVLMAGIASAQQALPALQTAQGKVEKVDKEALTVQPLDAKGKAAGKPILLKVTGTSDVSTMSVRDMSGKGVIVQKKTEARDLQPGQPVAIIYTTMKEEGNVLLSAVAQPMEKPK